MSNEWIFHRIGDPSSPLTRQAASLDFKAAAINAGVKNPERCNAKLIRMSLIQHLHDNGLSQHLIGQALGIRDMTKVARELDLSRMPGWDEVWASLNLVIDQ
jgi:integrase/recombinase XerD